MERDENLVNDPIETPVLKPEEETLAQTDEVIPAPADAVEPDAPVVPEIPADTIPADTDQEVQPAVEFPGENAVDLPTEPAVVEPGDVQPEEVVSEEPVDIPAEPAPVEPVEEPVAEPVPELPAEPSDVVVPEEPIEEPIPEEPIEEPIPEQPVETPIPEQPVEPGDETPVTVNPEEPVDTGCCGDPGCPTCNDESVSVGNFFGTLQESITIVWKMHLKTRKYSTHIALNEFYEKALDIVDDIIEQYQGIYGIVEEPFANTIFGDGMAENEYLSELKDFIFSHKSILGEHSEINSVVDDFLGLIDSTLYKVTCLKENNVKSYDEFVYEDYVKEGCCGSKEDDDSIGEEEEE